MEQTMQKCRRVGGTFDFQFRISEYESRSSEVRCQKTDLEIWWLSGVETSRITRDFGLRNAVLLNRKSDPDSNRDNNPKLNRSQPSLRYGRQARPFLKSMKSPSAIMAYQFTDY